MGVPISRVVDCSFFFPVAGGKRKRECATGSRKLREFEESEVGGDDD
jgi:hypothetical protein